MGVLARVRDFFATPSGSISSPRIYLNIESEVTRTLDGMTNAELYRKQPQLRIVIGYIANAVAQTSLKCYTRESDTDRRRDTEGIVPRLLSSPNPDVTGFELIYALTSELLLNDEALLLVQEDPDMPTGYMLRQIPVAWIQAWEGGDVFAPASAVITNPDTGATMEADAADLIYWHGWDPTDPRYGTSPVKALRQVLAEQMASWRYREQLWKRGARIPAYISRPKDVEGWTDAQAERFREAWRTAWSGNGSEAGGTPVLEDGMEIKASPSFSFPDAQWTQAQTLSLETVAAVYGLNPALVGSTSGQTYASVKENARQLYTETLGPIFRQITDRLNGMLLPRISAPDNEYVEFDISGKLAGSFEEQAQVLQSSTGAPWMTRNEARARLNLPAIEGGDELIVPLNVITGGLASPNDTTANSYAAGAAMVPQIVAEALRSAPRPTASAISSDASDGVVETKDDAAEGGGHYVVRTRQEDRDAVAEVLRKFFKRQAVSVLPRIGAAKGEKADAPTWWATARWNRELSADLVPVITAIVAHEGEEVAKALGIEDGGFSVDRCRNYIKAVAKGKAKGINDATLQALIDAISGTVEEGAETSTPEGVYKDAEDNRAAVAGGQVAQYMTEWTSMETIRQAAPGRTVLKTWRTTSTDPRPSHARMNGETVPYSEPFSNGAYFPGDSGHLDVADVAGCRCEVVLTIQ